MYIHICIYIYPHTCINICMCASIFRAWYVPPRIGSVDSRPSVIMHLMRVYV